MCSVRSIARKDDTSDLSYDIDIVYFTLFEFF